MDRMRRLKLVIVVVHYACLVWAQDYSRTTQAIIDTPIELVSVDHASSLDSLAIQVACQETSGADRFVAFLLRALKTPLAATQEARYFEVSKRVGERENIPIQRLALADFYLARRYLQQGHTTLCRYLSLRIIKTLTEADHLYWHARILLAKSATVPGQDPAIEVGLANQFPQHFTPTQRADLATAYRTLMSAPSSRKSIYPSIEAAEAAKVFLGEPLDRAAMQQLLSTIEREQGASLYMARRARQQREEKGELATLLRTDHALWRDRLQLEAVTTVDEDQQLTLLIELEQKRLANYSKIKERYPEFLAQKQEVDDDLLAHWSGPASLLYFVDFPDFIGRLLLTQDRIHATVIERKTEEYDLTKLTEAYCACVQTPPGIDGVFSRKCQTTGLVLYQYLLGDISSWLSDEVNLIIPNSLQALPFSALPVTADGASFLGDRLQLTYNRSMRLQRDMEAKSSSAKSGGILGFAPVFDLDQLNAATRNGAFGLKNTQAELSAIESLFPGSYFRETVATKGNLLRFIEDYGLIHLATHGRFEEATNEGYLVLSTPDPYTGRPLYAADIAQLTLSADLVVLSACEAKGSHQYLSASPLGFDYAFLAAGAKSVITSRWPIDDAATAELMTYFYTFLATGMPKDRALAEAQRKYRRQHAGTYRDHPYYWSAFVLTGDTSPYSLRENGWHSGHWSLWGSLILVGLILMGFFRWRHQLKKT
ncbi:MAG: CHAT domain-containing protein [Bacteroidota bacterium]